MWAAVVVFWACAAALAYGYVGYPLLLLALGLFRRRARAVPVRAGATDLPTVAVIIAAHNEEREIGPRIENALASDYPREKLEVIVASDGSTDLTEAVVRRQAGAGVRLVACPARVGKTGALSRAVRATSAETLVFSDANSAFAPDALRQLVGALADPAVGCVVGELRYRPPDGRNLSGEALYWGYESWLKRHQAQVGSLVGATGAIHAVRRGLYPELDPTAISDLEVGLHVVALGQRVAYEPRAVAFEDLPSGPRADFRRKCRIVLRSLGSLRRYGALLDPMRSGMFAVHLVSHKVVRWLSGALMLGLLLASAAASGRPFYAGVFWGQLAAYGLIAAAWALEARGVAIGVLRAPLYFCTVHAAALVALVLFVAGRTAATWEVGGSRGRTVAERQ